MAQANKIALQKEVERKLALENEEKRMRLERERKRLEPVSKTPRFLTRNALAKGLTNLEVPNLLPLRDAILSLSDPDFLNKKFNQDVYRELPQRVKDFINLPANQVTRAVIINKIIEAVQIAKKNNANNTSFNRGVAKALVNVAPKPKPNNNKPRVATTNTGTTGVNASTQANNLSSKIVILQKQLINSLDNAAEAAAVASAEQKAEANAKVAELTKALENVMAQLTKERNEAKKKVEELQNKLQSALNNTQKANLEKQLANAETALRNKNAEIATLKTSFNSQANMIINLQAQLEQAKQNAAEGKANANGKVAELTKKLESAMANLEKQKSKAEVKVASIQTEIKNATNNVEKANLKQKLANAQKELNFKNKVIALTRARAAVSKKKLAANKEAALAEVNQYKKDFAIAAKTLENLTKKGVANKQQISTLERSIRILETRLKNLGNRRVAETKGLRESIKELRSELQKLTTAPAPVQNTENSGKNNFRKKVQATINSGVNQNNKVALENIISIIPTTNLMTLERKYADVIGKPRLYLFLNQFKTNKNQFISVPSGIEGVPLSGSEINARNRSTEKIKEIIKTYGDNKVNLFFTGPSGSGKTTMFKAYLASKNINIENKMVTAYYPTFNYNLDGTLTINDVKTDMYYSEFIKRFIRPTPFNKTSSRAHMSVDVGGVTVFDLAGTENPLAIMWNSLRFNIFETKFWGFANQSFDTIYEQRGDAVELYHAIFGSKAPYKKLEGLDEMAALFIYWNFARRPGIIKKATSKATTLAARFMGKKPGTFNDIKEIMQYDPTFKTEEGETYGKWMFESIKRVFEGFYITRSLFSLKLLFSKSKYYNKNIANGFKNMASQEVGTILPGTNISNNGFSVKLKYLKGAKRLKTSGTIIGGTTEASQFVESLSKIEQNASGKFLILDKANPSYATKLLQSTKSSGNKNCIIGVVNANPSIENAKRSQQTTAVDYLKSLQK